MRAWLGRIRKLSDEETRSLAIWVSRYCAHPEKTLETVREVFKAAKERARQEREARLAAPASRTTAGGQGYPRTPNPSRSQLPKQVMSEPVVSPLTKALALLGLIILTITVTYIGRAVSLSTDLISLIFFVLALLGGWYLSICNEIQFLVLGQVSLKALFIHLIIFAVALIPAVIIYFITLFIMPWIAVGWVGGIGGAIIGSIGRSVVRGLGTTEEEEYEAMSFARFGGLSKQVLLLSLLGMIVGIGLGGIPGLDGIRFGGQEDNNDVTFSRCGVIMNRYAKGVTVGEIEAIIGKPPTDQGMQGFGVAIYAWNYDDIQVGVMTDSLDKKSFALMVECVEPGSDSPE